MGKVKTVLKNGVTSDSTKLVVVASSYQKIARKRHEPKGKVVVANTNMPNITESKGKVVKVLY